MMPQKQWLPERDNFLKEFIWLEGRGDDAWSKHCHGEQAHMNEPSVRCIDCEGLQLYCQSCVVLLHHTMPLHRVEIWTGNYFQHGGLRDLGLRVQLGHPTGVRCCNPSAAFQDDFTVLDTTGIHSIMLDFCNCETAQTHATQLLRAHWYPATVTNPRTAATFRVLNHFQMYTFESKGSVFEYYQSLAHLMDNIRRHQTKDLGSFRHILSLKRAGRGHYPGGVLGTMEGELAVLCPACPQPDKNLPLGWETSEVKHKWLYGLFLAIDANFRLCCCNKSSEEVNPSLSKGWGYFVEETGFKYKSSCASHNAVNLTDTKNSRGLAATGIGAIVCARHNLTRPSSVGDLQRGESKHLLEWMSRYPSQIHFSDNAKTLTFVVPKFHLPAHISACQTSYSLNLIKGMAWTDGEAIECGWSNMNPVATSTREMGPGSRHDILDDHFGDWNRRQSRNSNQHAVDLRDFEEAIPSSSLSSWWKMVEEWEDDRSRPNPFEVQASAVTQASVRLELSQLEAHQLRQGIDDSLHPDISPSVLIAVGIDIEALQRKLATDTASIGIHATDNQLSAMQQCINASRRQIEQWIQIQTLYIPSEPAHAINLWMPSAVVKVGMSCDVNLCNIKWKLRCAQAHDALHELRQHLRLKRHLTGFKKNWLTGQRYQMAWKALDALADSLLRLDWQIEFPKLEEQDIRGMTEAQAGGELESEGRRLVAVLWIWKQRHGAGKEELSEAMHVEWWAEEVELVQEEMRRVLAFFEWNKGWWEGLATSRVDDGTMEHEAAVAYALRQAAIRRSMWNDCLLLWDVVPSLLTVQTTAELTSSPANTM
ncbi:hypothetical protein DFJ58DRAFT_712348 [Suillus subalutaceus]|uniref:uncharacterized protein n=1 Tax=Suillus subalutaceus TaxID=48586 RepID=UPI001B85B794|nr:uncharacterized protein DFJ58DRAFT_712348 [Suillus subalutaceus]KAG1877639.1 hypothetical protein DFJ58DRAFT_712348 [Suillus subalutaceus]